MQRIYGIHLLIDGYVANSEQLAPDRVCDCFDKIVKVLNMKYLQPPTAIRVPVDPKKLTGDEDEGGWSVIAQITTSHISLHGWPLRGAFMMDIFSCKPFDTKLALETAKENLGITHYAVHEITRNGPWGALN